MLHLLRRVAALTILSALGLALLAPIAARSALPEVADSDPLLAVAERSDLAVDRGLAGRERAASLTLALLPQPIAPETLSAPGALPTPPSVSMEATLYRNPTPKPAPRPVVVAPPPSGSTVTGTATWYCCTAGYRGLAVVALPGALGGRYDPPPASRSVTVCGDRCVTLPVVDYCDCYWGTASQRVADLSPEAWAAVSNAPQSRGVITVTVHLGG